MKTTPLASSVLAAGTALAAGPRHVVYFDQWHKTTLPPKDVTAGISHVVTAFAPSNTFTQGTSYTPFMPLSQVRALFDQGTKVCMGVGGWGDNSGFSAAVVSEESRRRYAKNIAETLSALGYDCVDIDWEYPGGNGADYKQNPNSGKVAEIEAYPLLLNSIKSAIGNKELSIAVPGKKIDMIAFTPEQTPKIDKEVDFINVMTYDIMNRRDNVTNHHSSVADSLATVETYLSRGMSASKMNLGFAFYAKWFTTANGDTCDQATGCSLAVLEDNSGGDTGRSGAITFEIENYNGGGGNSGGSSFANAMSRGVADKQKGGMWYWDAAAKVYWTWDTPEFITRKMTEIVQAKKLGGVMAWSLAQDSHDWSHLKALQQGVQRLQ